MSAFGATSQEEKGLEIIDTSIVTGLLATATEALLSGDIITVKEYLQTSATMIAAQKLEHHDVIVSSVLLILETASTMFDPREFEQIKAMIPTDMKSHFLQYFPDAVVDTHQNAVTDQLLAKIKTATHDVARVDSSTTLKNFISITSEITANNLQKMQDIDLDDALKEFIDQIFSNDQCILQCDEFLARIPISIIEIKAEYLFNFAKKFAEKDDVTTAKKYFQQYIQLLQDFPEFQTTNLVIKDVQCFFDVVRKTEKCKSHLPEFYRLLPKLVADKIRYFPATLTPAEIDLNAPKNNTTNDAATKSPDSKYLSVDTLGLINLATTPANAQTGDTKQDRNATLLDSSQMGLTGLGMHTKMTKANQPHEGNKRRALSCAMNGSYDLGKVFFDEALNEIQILEIVNETETKEFIANYLNYIHQAFGNNQRNKIKEAVKCVYKLFPTLVPEPLIGLYITKIETQQNPINPQEELVDKTIAHFKHGTSIIELQAETKSVEDIFESAFAIVLDLPNSLARKLSSLPQEITNHIFEFFIFAEKCAGVTKTKSNLDAKTEVPNDDAESHDAPVPLPTEIFETLFILKQLQACRHKWLRLNNTAQLADSVFVLDLIVDILFLKLKNHISFLCQQNLSEQALDSLIYFVTTQNKLAGANLATLQHFTDLVAAKLTDPNHPKLAHLNTLLSNLQREIEQTSQLPSKSNTTADQSGAHKAAASPLAAVTSNVSSAISGETIFQHAFQLVHESKDELNSKLISELKSIIDRLFSNGEDQSSLQTRIDTFCEMAKLENQNDAVVFGLAAAQTTINAYIKERFAQRNEPNVSSPSRSGSPPPTFAPLTGPISSANPSLSALANLPAVTTSTTNAVAIRSSHSTAPVHAGNLAQSIIPKLN